MKACRYAAMMSVATVFSATATASADDAEAGKKVFAACRACHPIGEKAKNGVGPALRFGRRV